MTTINTRMTPPTTIAAMMAVDIPVFTGFASVAKENDVVASGLDVVGSAVLHIFRSSQSLPLGFFVLAHIL